MSNKSIYRSIWETISGEERIRVAVLGSKGSGKTVFLTSLANHLLNHDPARCPLNGWTVTPVEGDLAAGPDADGIPLYPYADARKSLADGVWPHKTKDWSVLRLALRLRNGKRRRDVLLEVLDLPGERVADFPMLGRSYREWCEWMGHAFGGVFGSSDPYKAYCRAAASAADQAGLFAAYRRFLAEEYAACSLSLTPSTVKLGRDAVSRAGGSADEFLANIADVPLGLDAERQFVPLPAACFEPDAAPVTKEAYAWIDAQANMLPWELRRDVRDDRVLIFSKKFTAQAGKIVRAHYAVRVVSAGDFILPGVSVEAMYAPEIRARERARRLTVTK